MLEKIYRLIQSLQSSDFAPMATRIFSVIAGVAVSALIIMTILSPAGIALIPSVLALPLLPSSFGLGALLLNVAIIQPINIILSAFTFAATAVAASALFSAAIVSVIAVASSFVAAISSVFSFGGKFDDAPSVRDSIEAPEFQSAAESIDVYKQAAEQTPEQDITIELDSDSEFTDDETPEPTATLS